MIYTGQYLTGIPCRVTYEGVRYPGCMPALRFAEVREQITPEPDSFARLVRREAGRLWSISYGTEKISD